MTHNTKIRRPQGGDSLVVESGGSLIVRSGGTLQLDSGVLFGGALATNPAGVVEAGVGASSIVFMQRQLITLTAQSITMTDATTAGCHGSLKIFTFPEGIVGIAGVVVNLALTAGVGGIADGAVVNCGIGEVTVGTDNGALASTEQNVSPATAVTLSSGAGTYASNSSAFVVLNGFSTPDPLFLNFAIADADASASDTLSVTGTVTFSWLFIGDR